MAKKTAKSKVEKKPGEDEIIAIYMDYVLEQEKTPRSVYKFTKDNGMSEQDFYKFFGSFE